MNSDQQHIDTSKIVYWEAARHCLISGPCVYTHSALKAMFSDTKTKELKECDMKILDNLMADNKKFDEFLSRVKSTDEFYPAIAAVKYFNAAMTVMYYRNLDYQIPHKFALIQLKKIIDDMESLKLRPEILGVYLALVELFAEISIDKGIDNSVTENYDTCIEILNRGITAYKDYYRLVNVKPWNCLNILNLHNCSKDEISSLMKKHFKGSDIVNEVPIRYVNLNVLLYQVYMDSKDNDFIFNLGLGLKTARMAAQIQKKKDFTCINRFNVCFVHIATSYLKRQYFCQTNHILAVAMYFLVEYRRSLPESRRHEVDKSQAVISNIYTIYGLDLMEAVLPALIPNKYGLIEPMPRCQTSCERLMEADGLQVYEKTFPTEYVVEEKKLQSIYKKTQLWLERTEKLNETEPSKGIATVISHSWVRLTRLKQILF